MARGNFGELLKRERELREVTLEEITSATRIGPRFLEALENEDWEKLPGGVFNRGFVRSVARYLGLDEEAFLAEYDLAYGTQVPAADERPEQRIPSPPKWIPALIILGILVLLGGLITGGIYVWRYIAARRSVKHSAGSGSTVPPPATRQVLVPVSTSSDSQPSISKASLPLPLELFVSSGPATQLRVQATSGEVLLELKRQAMPPLGVRGSSGTINLSREDMRQASGGNDQR
jgi:cytoskeletal protein RodZ